MGKNIFKYKIFSYFWHIGCLKEYISFRKDGYFQQITVFSISFILIIFLFLVSSNSSEFSILEMVVNLVSPISIWRVDKRFMRKAAQDTVMTLSQKKAYSVYLFDFIKDVIDKTKKKSELLPNLMAYIKDESKGELALKQSIAKGFFQRLAFFKKEAMSIEKISSKIALQDINEKADVRFLTELSLANKFANSQENVQKVTFNSENPNSFSSVKTKVSTPGGNYVKDITMDIKTSNSIPLISSSELDIKIGNNAYINPFGGILGPVPILADGTFEKVLCTKDVLFDSLQEMRRNWLFKNDITESKIEEISLIINLPFDDIQKNILIQDKLLGMVASGVLKKNPSFFVGFRVSRVELQEMEINFFNKMVPYISSHNFNTKKDFYLLASYAIKAYYEVVPNSNPSHLFDKELFSQTGFDLIEVESLF